MRRMMALLLAAALLAVLPGCGSHQPEQSGYVFYYPAADGGENGAAVGSEYRSPTTGRGPVDGIMQALLEGPVSEKLFSPFPEGTGLRGWRVDRGVARIDLTEPYGNLTGAQLSLADGCIALTLCQLDFIDAVYLTVEGRPRPYRDRVIRPSDLLTENGAGGPESVTANIYYPLGGRLIYETKTLELEVGDDPAVAVIRTLLEGPDSPLLAPIAPEGTRLLSLRREKDVFVLDVSEEWQETGGSAMQVLAIATTLDHLEPGARLLMEVEGEPLEEWAELDLSKPLSAPRTVEGSLDPQKPQP